MNVDRPMLDELNGDEVDRRLHDGVLQTLEFMASAGYGRLDHVNEYRRLACAAARDLRALIEGECVEAGSSLLAAVQTIANDAVRYVPDVDVVVNVAPNCQRLSCAAADPLLRAANEALTNVFRHSGATHVSVTCSRTSQRLIVDVCDDGCGMPESGKLGFGIQSSIIGRMAEAGGDVKFSRCSPHGTHVRLRLPAASVCEAAS